MPSKDTFLETYVPADPDNVESGQGKRSEIEISLCYDEGGMSYFDGKRKARGLKLRIWPVERGGGSTTRTLFDDRGRGFVFHEMERRNARVGDLAARQVEQRIEEIAAAARMQDWTTISKIVSEASECLRK